MKNRVSDDIENTRSILLGGKSANVYFETNEYVGEILDNFDVENKKVLTVLASGDQAFHFYNKGAKKVDVFDKNPLTIYYYYLRRWVILYLKRSYPDFNFNSIFLRNILKNVIPSDDREKMAIEYWTKFADLLDTLDIQSKYYFYDRVLLKKDDEFDCEKLSSILENDEFNFYNIDLAKKIKIPEKYDIIYTSNVSHYVKNTGTFNSYGLNLKHHLNKNGVIISSSISGFGAAEEEREILEKNFNHHILPEVYQPHLLDSYSPGYYYTKKRFWE